jgi:hypothetical protein
MYRVPGGPSVRPMPTFVLAHQHEPADCRVAYAAWKGFDSPLRRRHTMASCPSGEHRIYWLVDADSEADALAQLPDWVAIRTVVAEVSEVPIP